MSKENVLQQLEELTVEDLIDIQSKIGDLITSKQKRMKKDLLLQFKQMAAQSGLSLDEVMGNKSTGTKLKPKYRHPTDLEKTWVGRGKRPLWLQALLDNGTELESLTI